jgi:hypothetical protein
MRRSLLPLLPFCAMLPLGGCISTAASIVTAPVRVAAKGVDWATTSQDEADRNRGRKIRKQEERERKAARRAEKERAKAARQAADDRHP